MKKTLIRDLRLVSGEVHKKGTEFEISVMQDKPQLAVLERDKKLVKIRSANLHRYFAGFVTPSLEITDPDFDSAIVPSLTGELVEPDGWDEKGFPSVLLSMGWI